MINVLCLESRKHNIQFKVSKYTDPIFFFFFFSINIYFSAHVRPAPTDSDFPASWRSADHPRRKSSCRARLSIVASSLKAWISLRGLYSCGDIKLCTICVVRKCKDKKNKQSRLMSISGHSCNSVLVCVLWRYPHHISYVRFSFVSFFYYYYYYLFILIWIFISCWM